MIASLFLREWNFKSLLIAVCLPFFVAACVDGEPAGNNPAINELPTVSVVFNETVAEQTTVTLAATGFDTDGTIAGFSWTQTAGTTVTFSDSGAGAAPTFTTPTVTADETLTFVVTVTDNDGGTATFTLSILVTAVNALPSVNAGADQTVDEQTTATLAATGSDTDGTIASFSWTQTAGTTVTLSNNAIADPTFTTQILTTAETLIFEVTVTDNEGGTATDTVSILVNPVNALPSADAGVDQTVDKQTTVTLAATASDTDGTIDSYRWTQTDAGNQVTLSSNAVATPTFTAPTLTTAETLTFVVTVTDNEGGTATDTVSITVNPVNALPTVVGADQTVDEQTTVTLAATADDTDGTIDSYLWTQTDVGTQVTLSSNAVAAPTFTAPTLTTAETLTFEVTVTDNEGGTATDTVVVTVMNTSVTISGVLTYSDFGVDQWGINYDAPLAKPIRGVRLGMEYPVDSGSFHYGGTSDSLGKFAFEFPVNNTVRLLIYSILGETGSETATVVDNTNSGAIYTLYSDLTILTDDIVKNVNIPSGWVGDRETGSYSGPRFSAPFAILDDIYEIEQNILSADANAVFPPLAVNWSEKNKPSNGDKSLGEIGTSHYSDSENALYILGAKDLDTDEFDSAVIGHEWFHYFETNFSRSDSLGGSHGSSDILHPSVAFGEGSATAFSAMLLNDSEYIDTKGLSQQTSALYTDLEVDENDDTAVDIRYPTATLLTDGYWSEQSIMEVLYDLYDGGAGDDDNLALGFTPLYNVMVNEQANTPAFTSIHTFLYHLKNAEPTVSALIDGIANAENIKVSANNEFFDETELTLPSLYTYIQAGSPGPLVVEDGNSFLLKASQAFGSDNKLYNERFFIIDGSSVLTTGCYLLSALDSSSGDPFFRFPGGVFIDNYYGDLDEMYINLNASETKTFSVGNAVDNAVFGVQLELDDPTLCL
jgi:hypothetical protein